MKFKWSLCTMLVVFFALAFLVQGYEARASSTSSSIESAVAESVSEKPEGLVLNGKSSVEPTIPALSSEEPQGLLPIVSSPAEPAAIDLTPGEESQGLLPDFTVQPGGEWSLWTMVGVKVKTPPAAVSSSPGVVDIFLGGEENELRHLRYDGNWSNTKLFGPPPPNPENGVSFREYNLAAVYLESSPHNGVYHLFTWGATNHCLYKQFTETDEGLTSDSSDWTDIGGDLGSRPSATIASARIYLFALNGSGWLVHTWTEIVPDGLTWHNWTALAGGFTQSPAAATGGDGSIKIFVKSQEGELVCLNYSAKSGNFTRSIVGSNLTSPSVVSPSPKRLDIFAVSQNNTLMHRYHNGSAWQSWEDLGGAINYQPAAVSDRAGHIYVFVQGNT